MKRSSCSKFSDVALRNSVGRMKEARKESLKNVSGIHVSISKGNTKVGAIPSVSLLPVEDCKNCKACMHSCYDLRHDLIYKNVLRQRAANSAICKASMQRYFQEIDAWITCNFPRAFRWHIGGDIGGAEYLDGMVKIANGHPDVLFLAFTKAFSVVNGFLSSGGKIPDNLKIIFSGWIGQKMDNPFNLPTAHPLFSDGTTSAKDGAKLCTGNCTECLREHRLCWYVQAGDEIVFPAH